MGRSEECFWKLLEVLRVMLRRWLVPQDIPQDIQICVVKTCSCYLYIHVYIYVCVCAYVCSFFVCWYCCALIALPVSSLQFGPPNNPGVRTRLRLPSSALAGFMRPAGPRGAGRGLVVSRAVQPGEILLKERAVSLGRSTPGGEGDECLISAKSALTRNWS